MSRAILMVVLVFTLVTPLSAPIMVLAETSPQKSADPYTPPALTFGCGVTNLGACIPQAAWGVMVAFGQVMAMTSLALNYSVQKLVVGMGTTVRDSSMESINVAWRTMRDLVNVLLVFLTIFIGIATIIGISGYGYKQLLWKVVLAALFVNFSITFTKFIIDISNIVSIETYAQILRVNVNPQGGSPGSDPALCTSSDQARASKPDSDCLNKGLSAVFMQQMKLTTIYSSGTIEAGEVKGPVRLKEILWIAIFGSIFFLIAAFVFGAAAFFIILRFAILLLLIILSPIGLVAWITGVSGIGRQWWHQLLNQSFFLPIMFILWWASVQVMVGMNEALMRNADLATSFSAPGSKTITANPGNFDGIMGVFLYFFIVSALLIASLVIARNLGAYGASRAMSLGKSWSRAAGGLAFAGTVGAASSRAANLYQRRMANAQAKDADGKYVDPSRRAQFARKIAGTKIDRFTQTGLGAGANTGVLGTKSLNQRREKDKKEKLGRLNELADVGAREGASGHAATLSSTTATKEQKDAARRSIQALSAPALEEMSSRNPKLFNDPHFAQSLSAKQMDALQQSQNIDKGVLANTQTHRTNAYTGSMVATTPPGGAPTTDVRAGRRSTKAMSESELRTLGTSLSDRITRAPGTKPLTTTEVQHVVETLPGAQVTNLSDNALVNPDVYPHLNAAQLTALNNADRLTDAERRTIRTAVLAGGGTASARNWFDNPTGPGASWV